MRIKTIIFFSIFSLYICPSYAVDIYEKFNEANILILSEQFPEAKKILDEIHKKRPQNLQIINNLAYIEAKLGDIDGAIKILRDSISNDKYIDIIYKNLTNLYAFQANILYEEALSIKESNVNEVSLSLVENLITNNVKNIDKNKENNKTIQSKINQEDVKSFINEWASFWQNKNYKEYFNCYKDSYYPKKFKSRNAWISDREEKIKNKKNIEIKISNIKIIGFDNKNILVQFTQAYNSDSFSDVVNKHTIMIFSNGRYRITGEYILR